MQHPLSNPLQPPTQVLLQSVMGENYTHFEALGVIFNRLGITWEWNYYRDGKSWLCKAQYRKKTVLWLSVWEGFFRLSFFFTKKTRHAVCALDIRPEIRSTFQMQEAARKLIPLILDVNNRGILNDAETLIRYKIA